MLMSLNFQFSLSFLNRVLIHDYLWHILVKIRRLQLQSYFRSRAVERFLVLQVYCLSVF